MTEKCVVCKTEIKSNDKKCPVCGFTDLHKDFISKEDAENWMKTVVEPYRNQWNPEEPEEIRRLRRLAESGNAAAQNNLGVRYSDGNGVEQDHEKALYWFRKAAEQREPMAQYHIALAYDNGTGVSVDYTIAAQWKEKAAMGGNALAQRALGYCYDHGKGVQQDYKKAAYWYRKASDQGNGTAANNLGILYEYGRGVELNYDLAEEYYKIAVERGCEIAEQNLTNLAKKQMEVMLHQYANSTAGSNSSESLLGDGSILVIAKGLCVVVGVILMMIFALHSSHNMGLLVIGLILVLIPVFIGGSENN